MSENQRSPTPEELLTLSAYIDGDLSPPERTALEARLETDEGLKSELDSLRQTVTALRTLPVIKAPRNFTLNPAVYGQSTRVTRLFTRRRVVGLVAAAASLILVFAIVISMNGDATRDSEEAANAVSAVAMDVTTEVPQIGETAGFVTPEIMMPPPAGPSLATDTEAGVGLGGGAGDYEGAPPGMGGAGAADDIFNDDTERQFDPLPPDTVESDAETEMARGMEEPQAAAPVEDMAEESMGTAPRATDQDISFLISGAAAVVTVIAILVYALLQAVP